MTFKDKPGRDWPSEEEAIASDVFVRVYGREVPGVVVAPRFYAPDPEVQAKFTCDLEDMQAFCGIVAGAKEALARRDAGTLSVVGDGFTAIRHGGFEPRKRLVWLDRQYEWAVEWLDDFGQWVFLEEYNFAPKDFTRRDWVRVEE